MLDGIAVTTNLIFENEYPVKTEVKIKPFEEVYSIIYGFGDYILFEERN